MEAYFSTMFVDIRHERSLLLLLTLTETDNSRQRKFTHDETNIIKNLALEKLHPQNYSNELFCIETFRIRVSVQKVSTFPTLNN